MPGVPPVLRRAGAVDVRRQLGAVDAGVRLVPGRRAGRARTRPGREPLAHRGAGALRRRARRPVESQTTHGRRRRPPLRDASGNRIPADRRCRRALAPDRAAGPRRSRHRGVHAHRIRPGPLPRAARLAATSQRAARTGSEHEQGPLHQHGRRPGRYRPARERRCWSTQAPSRPRGSRSRCYGHREKSQPALEATSGAKCAQAPGSWPALPGC